MIDFIPLHQYSSVVYGVLLAFIASLCVMLFSRPGAVMYHPRHRNEVLRVWGWGCLAILLLLLGLRPISYAFGDMGNYHKNFLVYQSGALPVDGDLVFEWTMWLFANFLNASLFFFFCVVVYLAPIVVAAQKLLSRYWALAFFFTIAQIDFYGYGVNGIRQGMAASVFLLAIFADRKWHALFWTLVAVGLHKSFLVPAAFLFAVQYVWNPRYYVVGWLACLVIAALFPGIGSWLADSVLSAGDFDQYLDPDSYFVEQFSSIGFRADFLMYSMLPMVVGGYFLFLRKIRDPLYSRIYCLYVGSNAFWLIMMQTVLSNRIAYLSWFLMGFVITYPLVVFRGMPSQHQVFSVLLMSFYLFTYVART